MKTKVNLGIALFFGILFSIFILTGTGCTDVSKDIEPVKIDAVNPDAPADGERDKDDETERGLTIG